MEIIDYPNNSNCYSSEFRVQSSDFFSAVKEKKFALETKGISEQIITG